MADFDADVADALNTLLEDERASVEMEVALASGASAYAEREMLVAMGADDISFCVALHEQLERAGAPVTRRINGVVFQALGAERYDDRLLVFARHQLTISDRYRDLPTRGMDDETRSLLHAITTTHERQIEWLERSAQAFAATRQFDFKGAGSAAISGGADQAAPFNDPATLNVGANDDSGPDAQDTLDTPGTPNRSAGRATPGGIPDGIDEHDAPNGHLAPTPDGSTRAIRRSAPIRRPQRLPYTPGAATLSDDGEAPAAPPTLRGRIGAQGPGAPDAPDAPDDAAYPPAQPAPGAAQPYAPDPSYTYAESDYPYDTPGAYDPPTPPAALDGSEYTPYGPDSDERDRDG